MATTKIWDVRGRIDKPLNYATNPNKTINPDFNDSDLQGLRDVMDYAKNDFKTEKQYYVSGLNCSPEIARQEMMITKKQYGKTGGIIAYHSYQSFAEKEVTPEVAHEIGIKLAKELWGDRFEVIIATHLNTKCVHNHFVLNSVSFKDGLRYYDQYATHDRMRFVSDKLCREYGLSVIDEPKRGRHPSYDAYLADQQGKPTHRGLLREDIDKAILQSVTMTQFLSAMKEMDYEIKHGKYLAMRPDGNERFMRLYRLGDNYSEDKIIERILENTRRHFPEIPEEKKAKHFRFKGNLKTAKKMSGLRALYFSYLYKMGVLPKYKQSNRKIHFLYREDIRKMDSISEEARLLCKYRIDTVEQLSLYKTSLQSEIKSLCVSRIHLRYKARSITDVDSLKICKDEISALTAKIGKLRKEVKQCENIETRSIEMKGKIQKEALEKNDIKEENQNEHIRRSR